jgi:hypothetical protein
MALAGPSDLIWMFLPAMSRDYCVVSQGTHSGGDRRNAVRNSSGVDPHAFAGYALLQDRFEEGGVNQFNHPAQTTYHF